MNFPSLSDEDRKALVERLVEDTHAFKNFHRLLCERFGYTHDENDWRRDQLSLIEWIVKNPVPSPPPLTAERKLELIREAFADQSLTTPKTIARIHYILEEGANG